MQFIAEPEHPKLAHFPKVFIIVVTCEMEFTQTLYR
jgi:hypothetical protein